METRLGPTAKYDQPKTFVQMRKARDYEIQTNGEKFEPSNLYAL